ncbi:MAG: 6-phospho-beta-glucosidase [Anaerolinea sp.]|nr:6-phospho-beta-glucosidase [Anaerolinea sp.]
MKIVVIGGGSSYTPELINGFLARVTSLPLTELWLVDVLPERLEVVGRFAQRMVAAQGSPFRVHLTTDRRHALPGAAYVLTQLRVGWMAARRADEYLGQRHGLIGQETTGVGGMAKALRTIPVILDIARDMEELAPGALLVNFTNPAGLITEALTRYAPNVPSVGVCNVPYNMKMTTLEHLAAMGIIVEPERAQLDTLGLNHLTWHRGFAVDGEELWPRIMAHYVAELRASDAPEWDPSLIATLQMVPNYYLHYFYQTAHKLAQQDAWPPSRAEEVLAIEEKLLAQYAEPDRSEPPEGLMQRGGAYYSTVATQLLAAHYNDLQETHIVNVAHRGAVAGWPQEWVLELPCRVGREGIVPLPTRPLPPVCYGLLAQVKMYEMLTAQAAVTGDRELAYQALLANPLGPAADQVETVLEDLLQTHRAYLPQFWREA